MLVSTCLYYIFLLNLGDITSVTHVSGFFLFLRKVDNDTVEAVSALALQKYQTCKNSWHYAIVMYFYDDLRSAVALSENRVFSGTALHQEHVVFFLHKSSGKNSHKKNAFNFAVQVSF